MKKRINTLFDSKPFLVVISLLASILLWVYVTSTGDNITTIPLNDVQVIIRGQTTLNSRGLTVTDVDTHLVSLRLSGNRSDLYNLKSWEMSAVLDVSQILQAQETPLEWSYTLAFPSGINASEVEVVWASTDTISFVVDKLISKNIEVVGRFDGRLSENYIHDPVTVSPNIIRVTGSEKALNRISHGLVTVSRDDADTTISIPTEYALVDVEGEVISDSAIIADISEVNVTVPILMMKEVELRVDWEYTAGATPANVFPKFEPQTIVIAGAREIIEPINTVSVGRLNLSSFAYNFEGVYPVVLRDGVRNISGVDSVTLNVDILDLATERYTVTDITCVNVTAGLVADVLTENLEITIRWRRQSLDQISVKDIRAELDLAGIDSEGNYTLPVTISVNGSDEAGALFEPKAAVSVKANPETEARLR